jgi:hypothetical protein
MQCLYQRHFLVSVRKVENSKLLAKTIYSDTETEHIAQLVVDMGTFVIESAYIERRPKDYQNNCNQESTSVTALKGIPAYLGSGQKIRQALRSINSAVTADLFLETVKGVIQSETQLYEQRGFSSINEYEKYWREIYTNVCCYYSNLDRVEDNWDKYTHLNNSTEYLFLRSKNYHVYCLAPEKNLILGNLLDTFHEINVSLEIGKHIDRIEADLKRVPDKVCREAIASLQNLINFDIFSASNKKILRSLGKGQGCVHLNDVVNDCIDTAKIYHEKSRGLL